MKVELKLPIEVGKTYYTKCGKKVRIYATDGTDNLYIHGAVLESTGWDAQQWLKDGSIVFNTYYSLNITHEEWEPADKELVWCWDNNKPFIRSLCFYDVKNRCTFYDDSGRRDGMSYDNYAPYEGEWPEWAKEAYKKLVD